MGTISTEAWVLHAGDATATAARSGPPLTLENFSFSDMADDEVIVEPLIGCWEGNMTHAVARSPVDVCLLRGERRIVLGNSGVVRVAQAGREVRGVREGDVCLVFGATTSDAHGYMMQALAYDAPNTMGILAKRSKLHERNLIRIPTPSKYSITRWAAFSVRYVTAWSNWRVAHACWRAQMTPEDQPRPWTWGWGGGTTLAELTLARLHGAHAAMIASTDVRLKTIAEAGLRAIDRRGFPHVAYDDRCGMEAARAAAHEESERIFLDLVREHTEGRGASIFLDYVGTPVVRSTLKALARQGVLATAGWKHGMMITTVRAIECIGRHIHVNTHYARRSEAIEAVQFAERTGWLPPVTDEMTAWEDVPALARRHAANENTSYFPLFRVNNES